MTGKALAALLSASAFLVAFQAGTAFAQEPAPKEEALKRIAVEERYLKEVPESVAAMPGNWFEPGIKAIYYAGPDFKGKPTKVFAFFGVPQTKAGEKVPAMVLVHGGGGTAFSEWVKLWNSRGYAAIAMDLCGCVPVRKPDNSSWIKMPSFAGPDGWDSSFNQLNDDLKDQWPSYAVNAIARARTFIGAQQGVDGSKVGITGISWGGYLTCLSASLDSRYLFAAPVYGCGFLFEKSAWSSRLAQPGMDRWSKQADPSVYLAEAKMPFLWVTGTNDFAYHMEQLKKSYSLVKPPVSLCVAIRMAHGHSGPGERPEEIKAFADSFCKGGEPLPSFSEQGVEGKQAWALFKSPQPLEAAELIFTKAEGPNKERLWESLAADIDKGAGKVSAALPDGVKLYYFNIRDARKLTASSRLCEAK